MLNVGDYTNFKNMRKTSLKNVTKCKQDIQLMSVTD